MRVRLAQNAHNNHYNGSNVIDYIILSGPSPGWQQKCKRHKTVTGSLNACELVFSTKAVLRTRMGLEPPTPKAPDLLWSSACTTRTSQLPEQQGGYGQEGEMRVAKAVHTWAASMATLWRRPSGVAWNMGLWSCVSVITSLGLGLFYKLLFV